MWGVIKKINTKNLLRAIEGIAFVAYMLAAGVAYMQYGSNKAFVEAWFTAIF